MGKFKVQKAEKTRINDVDFDNLKFGYYFSDHVFETNYADGKWDEGVIKPYGPMAIEPANCALHYSQTIFEGLKAFRDVNGGANIFRPIENAKRLNRSAERMCMPTYDPETLVEAIKELVYLDRDWIPKKRGEALYIRPVCFGTTNLLKVQAATEYKLLVILSPVASYYASGLNPVKILVEDKFVRAAPGGTGAAKTGGNYAASLLSGKLAAEKGYSQVLWLDAVSRTVVNEVGAMNIMFVIDDELITPSLDSGTILPGITRDSVLKLARDWGMKVSERDISIDEIIEASQNGKLQEAFGTGTAAVVTPVGVLGYKGKDYTVNDMKIGPITQKIYDELTGIQYGEREDKFGWNVHLDF